MLYAQYCVHSNEHYKGGAVHDHLSCRATVGSLFVHVPGLPYCMVRVHCAEVVCSLSMVRCLYGSFF